MQFANPYPLAEVEQYLGLKFNQFEIIGRSIAGVETNITIPQFNISFDTGRAPNFAFAQDYLALSHWHLDHAGGLAFYLGLRRLNKLAPLNIIVPFSKMEKAQSYLKALQDVSDTEISYQLLNATDPIQIKNNLWLQAIPSFHCAPSQGYLIEQKKRALRSEYRQLNDEQIKVLKANGADLHEESKSPYLVFSGDTTGKFLAQDHVRKAKYLLMECSFFGEDDDYQKVLQYGHTHIKDWAEYASGLENEVIIMIHTSQRFSKKEIEQACLRHLPKSVLDRLIIFR